MSGWKRIIRHRMAAAVGLLLLAASIAIPAPRILAADGAGSAASVDSLPYAGKDLAMLVMLPDGDLGRFEAGLTAQQVQAWQRQLAAQQVQVYLPRFKFGTRYYLDRILPELGMSDAFSPGRADFSGMTGDRDLYIKHVIHQAVIDVNEQGSEATAATAVVMERKSMSPVFRADHPFVFAIVHQPTGSLLFLGRVADPSRS